MRTAQVPQLPEPEGKALFTRVHEVGRKYAGKRDKPITHEACDSVRLRVIGGWNLGFGAFDVTHSLLFSRVV